MTPPSRWEIYLACAAEDARSAGALYDALCKSGARIFWRQRDVAPGEDERAVMVRALEGARIGVFALSRATSGSMDVRSDVAAAIARFRGDPTRRVIPVHFDDTPRGKALFGTNILKELSVAAEGGEAAVATRILELLRRYRAQERIRPRIAVVAVTEELSAAQDAAVALLRRLALKPEVSPIDAADPEAFEKTRLHDFRLFLVGMRTGGTQALERLAATDAARLKASSWDRRNLRKDEIDTATAIGDAIDDSFASPDEAAKKAADLFASWLNRWAPPEEGHGPALEPWEAKYLRARLKQWEKGSYGGLKALGRSDLDRARLYVSLRAAAEPACHAGEDEKVVLLREDEAGALSSSKEEREKQRDPFLERVLSHPGLPFLALEGEAGSGKTVLLQHVAYALACRHLNEPAPKSQLDEAGLAEGAPLLRIPILLEAKRLVEFLPEGELGELTDALVAALRKATDEPSVPADGAEGVRAGLRAGRYLILIDSLDEVPTAEERSRLLNCLEAFVQCGDCRSRLVLTSRPMAHTGVSLAGRGMRVVRIAALGEEQIEQMVDRWADATGEDSDSKAALLRAIGELELRHPAGRAERSIPQNPQLLTCAFLVFAQQRILPDSPAALFDRMVKILCDARPSSRSSETKRLLLERVFESIQRAGGTECEVETLGHEALLGAQADIDTVRKAVEVLDQLASETGLLRFEGRRGPRKEEQRFARPWHRSFEEYLCACRLAAAAGSVAEETDRLVGTVDAPGVLLSESWEGVVTFLFGVHAERGRERAEAYVERLLRHGQERLGPVPARRRGRILGVAARCIAENPKTGVAPALRDELRMEIAQRFAEEGARWPLSDRLLALEALGRLGDPRLDSDPWVDIEGGTFTMGGDSEAFQSLPAQEVTVGPFRLMWRPVTVQDYQPFVESDGYSKDEWWEAGRLKPAEREPDDWRSQLYHPNRPVVGVSWFEAMAFCHWATREWGLEVDLPTEAEWESAARGSEGTAFPWGEEEPGKGDAARANHWAIDVRHASPVGAFPSGNRGRLADLAGNVWEWCLDEWSSKGPWKPPRGMSPRGSPRVVRGGSWGVIPGGLRCAYRRGNGPRDRLQGLGFRVVCRGSRQPFPPRRPRRSGP
jgi:formylglycine-generating enzyme required for sulfatase activity